MEHDRDLKLGWVDTRDGFAALEPEWDPLVKISAPTVFLTHSWLSNWLSLLGEGRILRVLTAHAGDRLVAALPLVSRTTRARVRLWEFMGSGLLTPNHLDMIALPDYRDAALRGFAGMLLDSRALWDVLDLNKLPADSATASKLATLFSAAGFPTSSEVSAVCPCAVLPDSYEVFLAGLTRRSRRRVRRGSTEMQVEHPETRFSVVCDEKERAETLAALVRLHQARWEGRGYAGSFADPHVVEFHEATTRYALREGSLRFFRITEGDQVIAATLCYQVGDVLQGYSTGFDSDWGQYAPGVLLLAYSIEQAIAEGATLYDGLEGEEFYKTVWCRTNRENVRLQIFNRSAGGILARTQKSTASWFIAVSRRVVPAKARVAILKTVSRSSAVRPRELKHPESLADE